MSEQPWHTLYGVFNNQGVIVFASPDLIEAENFAYECYLDQPDAVRRGRFVEDERRKWFITDEEGRFVFEVAVPDA